MAGLICEREYLRTVRQVNGDVRLEVRLGLVGEWREAQTFAGPVADGVLDFFEQAADLTVETLGDELDLLDELAAHRERLERDCARVRKLYRALSDV